METAEDAIRCLGSVVSRRTYKCSFLVSDVGVVIFSPNTGWPKSRVAEIIRSRNGSQHARKVQSKKSLQC